MFVVSNYSDTIIEDLTIEFFDENNGNTTFHATDAEMIDYDDYGAGILRVFFPFEEIMPLLERSSTMEVLYDAKSEHVLMKHLLMSEELDLWRVRDWISLPPPRASLRAKRQCCALPPNCFPSAFRPQADDGFL